MKRIGTVGVALLATLAVGVIASATAGASPQKLNLTWNGETNELVAGQEFKMWNISNVTFATDPGSFTCESSEADPQGWIGKDQTNDETTDDIELEFEYGGFEYGDHCANTTGLGSFAWVRFDPNLAILKLSAKGKAEIKGEFFPMVLEVLYSGGAGCAYEPSRLKGTLSLEPWRPEPRWSKVAVTFANQKAKLEKLTASPGCPRKVAFTAAFPVQTSSGYNVFGKLVP